MATFEGGSWVWVPDDKDMVLPGKVIKAFKPGEEGKVKLEDGREVVVDPKKSKECIAMDEAALLTYDNMIKLNDLNEPTILHNLRQRFLKDQIYTYVSSILVALNPFKLLPIYTPEVLDKYKDRGSRNQPPHIFAIADNAYANLMADFRDQAVVISGESGAGKTETMKLVLQFLAEASGRANKQTATGEKTESLEQQVLKSNPLMEAFGNAKTTRNNNSSRFGKWTEIKFNRAGAIVGGSIVNYLLEKSRIPYQAANERNYHAFYQLIAGAELDKDMQKRYRLSEAESFHYTNQSGATTVDGINDEKDWLEMTNAMDVLNMSAEEKECTFRLVAACLQMGNVDFERDPKGVEETDSKVKNVDQLNFAAELFRVDKDVLAKSMCYRKISRPGSKSLTYARYSIQKAKDARDAMSKTLYGKLFDWLIQKINVALMQGIGTSSEKLTTIGVLDIFGFESFATNSFEQLCINYCNEKLQFHFNEYIFKLEQDEYKSEGIPVDLIEFKDNQPTLDMLEKKGEGVFAMIDEELNVPKGSDETFLKKVLAKHAKHPNFAAPKPKDLNANLVFIVIHYAGAVPYNVTSFLEKNRDALNDDIIECVNASKCPLISRLLRVEEDDSVKGGAKKKQPTLGFQFKESLGGLMTALYKCEPHFVRCMKSNHQKKGNIFEADMMLAQLRYAGLLEVCRIRKIGFPVRRKFDDFVFRYRCLDLIAARKGHKELCAAMEAKKILESRQWAIGFTKVFMRNLQQTKCEAARENALKDVVTHMTRAARGFIARRRMKRYKATVKALKKAIKTRTEEALEAALVDVPDLPYGGNHIGVVKDARALKERLEEERRVTGLCVDAVKARDLNELRNACKAADEMTPPFDSPAVKEAKDLLDLMERERKAVKKLKSAIDARDLDQLTEAIEGGAPFGKYVVDTDAYKQAVSLKARIEEENAARKALKKAMKAKDLEALYPALAKMSEMGLDGEDVYKEAVELKDSLEEQRKAIAKLKEVIAERVLEPLQSALKKAKKVGVPAEDETFAAGKELEAVLLEEKETEDELFAAAKARDAARIEKALKKATKMKMPETPGVKEATKMRDRLKQEEEALAALKAAIKANRAPALMGAMNRVSELGMDGIPEMDKARDVMSKLGEQSEALLKLQAAINDADLDAISDALKKLKKMGLGEEPEVLAGKDAADKIVRQNELSEDLKKRIKKRDRDGVKAALEAGEAINFSKRFQPLIDQAGELLKLMDLEDSIIKEMGTALDNNDEEALDDQVTKAKAAGADARVFEAADAARAKLGERRALLAKLTESLEADAADTEGGEEAAARKELIQALVDEATAMGLEGNSKVQQAVQALNREKLTKETKKALKKAMKSADEKALSEALEQAISLGMKGEEVTKAKSFSKRLEEEKELASGVKAAMKSLSVKADSKTGVTSADLKPLAKAMEEARAQGLSDDSPFMKQAIEAKERLEKVLQLQADVQAALDSGTLRQMKKVLDRAEDLELGNSALVKKLKARVREEEKARSKSAVDDDDGGGEAVPSLDDEEMKKLRAEKMKKASSSKYNFAKYNKIRTPDDFARGILLNKKKVKASQLRWQAGVIPTSILDYSSKELAKTATRLHKDILGYAGDKTMSFPATLAQDILQKGLEFPELVDEIYVQLCKHLTHNPRPESAVRGWQLMCMCVGTFPPSRDFENYLINFILEHKDGAGAVGRYAQYALRRLEGIINSGPSGFVPSVDEISAYKERPPILATIVLVDGTPLTEDLPITPDLNVAKVLDICNHFMELQDDRMQYFGVFVEDVDDEDAPKIDPTSDDAPPYAGLPKSPRPLQNENFMGDVVTIKYRHSQKFKFVYKRKIFLKNLDDPSEDSMFERLVYLQAVDEVVKGNVPVDSEDEAARLAAIALVVYFADEFEESQEFLVEKGVAEYIPPTFRDAHEPEEWADKVLAHATGLLDADPEELQAKYVEAVKSHPLYGTCFFHVRKHKFPEQMEAYPDGLIIALNSEGLHFLNEEREVLASFGYADIYRWGGSSTQFNIIIWNPEAEDTDDVAMFTSQAADMAALILDYINAIMATTDGA